MRKMHKRQAEDFVELLGQAHEEIRRAIEKNNIPTALHLLEDCQEGAISLGNLIETTEGEDTGIVPILEDYCEQVYRLHEAIAGNGQGMAVNANKSYKRLRQSLFQIRNRIQNLKVHLEAVFLPYKASMWDSLESVWRAAWEDPDCEPYVIPIPYYDRNPDGSFRELHYEGDQYPAYVPVTGYQDYDFEKRKPDMVFIHNPYDDCNYVTSVDPFFYSGNLKRFTERLVYIPYFVLKEVEPDDEEAVERIKHFCMVPGVANADLVIVQSEKMRQVYIKVWTDQTTKNESSQERKKTKKYWENKIKGIGSPKLDRVLGIREADLQIPEEWLQVICKPDGNRKKIILYNTSVTALLYNSEKMLDKMEDTFKIFRDAKDEVALLWRPHPLMEVTIVTMRPGLLERYAGIVRQYREEKWGIYDDTADVERAIMLSDAYYGDGSSLVQLCQSAGRPVMIQDVNVLST